MGLFDRDLNSGESINLIVGVKKEGEDYFVTFLAQKRSGELQRLQSSILIKKDLIQQPIDPRRVIDDIIQRAMILGSLNPSSLDDFIL